MTDNRRHFSGMIAWVAFFAASTIILFVASTMIHYTSSGSGGTVADQLGEVLPYVMIGGLLLYYSLRPLKRGEPTFQGTRSLFSSLGRVIIIPVIFLFVVFIVKLLGMPAPVQMESPVSNPPNPVQNPLLGASGSPSPSPMVFVGAMVIVVAIAVFLSMRSLRRRVETKEEIVDLGADDLRVQAPPSRFEVDDIRRSILYRYVQGRSILVRKGAPIDDVMTAREFEGKVVLSYEEASSDFVPLTRLFEEARFSTHKMGGEEKEKADTHYQRLARISQPENEERLETDA